MRTIPKRAFFSGLVENCIDAQVYHDVLKAYSKETISFLDYGNLSITTVAAKHISRVEFTECEISPFRKHEIDCSEIQATFKRPASVQSFSDKKIIFSDIQKFLVNCFSPSEEGHRPYPSAGGLYPIEPLVFLFAERTSNKPDLSSGCYHYRGVSKKLQLIKKIDTQLFFKELLHGYFDLSHLPCFALLYTAHLGKTIFKYRYRGYRQALMEAGSMYQQAILISQQMGLRNTVWSTFSEPEMLYHLELDPGTYLPLTMHFFGYDNEPDGT